MEGKIESLKMKCLRGIKDRMNWVRLTETETYAESLCMDSEEYNADTKMVEVDLTIYPITY